MQGALATHIDSVNLCATSNQFPDNPCRGGPMEGSFGMGIPRVWIRPGSDERGQRLLVAATGRKVQGALAIRVGCINLCFALNQFPDNSGMAVPRCEMQRCASQGVARLQVGLDTNEHPDSLGATCLGRHMKRGALPWAHCSGGGTSLEQRLDDFQVAAVGGPM